MEFPIPGTPAEEGTYGDVCLLFPVTLPFKQSLQLTLLLLLRVHSQGLWTLPRPWLGLLSEGVHLTANRSISKAAAHMCSFGPEPVGAGMTALEENVRTWRAPGWSCSVHRQKHFFLCQIVHSKPKALRAVQTFQDTQSVHPLFI